MAHHSNETHNPQGVGKTSLLIAAARAVESELPENERLISDPYARYLCGDDEGKKFLEEFETAQKGVRKLFALRTRFIDDLILTAIERGISQIVLLGAGMDTRALRLNTIPPSVKFFEVDLPHVIDYKENILRDVVANESNKIRPLKVSIKADLTKDNWPGSLGRHGFNASDKALFILEGVIMYLDEKEVHAVFQLIRSVMAPGSELLVHTITEKYLKAENAKARELFDEAKAMWKFGTDEPEKLLKDFPELVVSKVHTYVDLNERYNAGMKDVSLNSAFVLASLPPV